MSFGELLPDIRVEPPGPRSREAARRLRVVESQDVTHVDVGWPIFWEEARGGNVRDVDGNVFLDLTGAFGVALLGHAPESVVAAVEAQSHRLLHGMGDIHPPRIKLDLLERLAELAPWGETRTVLSSTGSEAVETALKTAQVATGKPGILAFEGAYHGLTLGALAATDREHFRGRFLDRLYGGVGFVPYPDANEPEDGEAVLEQVASVLRRGAPNGDPVGAVLVEPMQGRGGARVPPDGFMAGLTSLARECGAVLIADEVFTGSGRCGGMLASPRVGLDPDVVCLGKALGGGVPLSACLGRADVMDRWPESTGEAVHTSTFLGHPLGCAAALAVLGEYEREDVYQRVLEAERVWTNALGARLASCGRVRDIRGLGLLLGVELGEEDGRRGGARLGGRVAESLLKEGVLVLPAGPAGNVVELTPSVNLTGEQVAHAVEAVATAIEGIQASG